MQKTQSSKQQKIQIKFIIQILIVVTLVTQGQTQGIQFLYMEDCRISLQNEIYFKCQLESECLDDPPPSSSQICAKYGYAQISESLCILNCCPGIVASQLDFFTIQKCTDQWRTKQIVFVVSIVFAIIGAVGILIGAGLTFIYGFVRNPYNGKYVWRGCCCCAKKLDFSQERGDANSDDRLGRGKMIKEKKVNLKQLVPQQ